MFIIFSVFEHQRDSNHMRVPRLRPLHTVEIPPTLELPFSFKREPHLWQWALTHLVQLTTSSMASLSYALLTASLNYSSSCLSLAALTSGKDPLCTNVLEPNHVHFVFFQNLQALQVVHLDHSSQATLWYYRMHPTPWQYTDRHNCHVRYFLLSCQGCACAN